MNVEVSTNPQSITPTKENCLSRVHLFGGDAALAQKMTNFHDLFFGQFPRLGRSERVGFSADAHRPVATVSLVNLTESLQQTAHVVPVNVVIDGMAK